MTVQQCGARALASPPAETKVGALRLWSARVPMTSSEAAVSFLLDDSGIGAGRRKTFCSESIGRRTVTGRLDACPG